LGIQAGVQYVCVAVITRALGSNQVSARLLDVETAKVVGVGTADSPLRTMEHLNQVSEIIVKEMLTGEKQETATWKPVVRFGVRGAYNNSFVSNASLTVDRQDDSTDWLPVTEEHDGKPGAGSGFSLGGVFYLGLSPNLGVSVGADFIYRTPVVTDVSTMTEMALGIPVLVQWKVLGSPLYIEGGAQIDIPFGTKNKLEWDNEALDVDGRKGLDVGIAVGAGYYVTKSITVDLRAVIGVTQFDHVNGRSLNQVCIGVSYLF